MKVLVTGASGFVGSHLVDLLLEKKFNVSCLVRESSSMKWLESKNINLIFGDLNDSKTLEQKIKNFDIVYHVAGKTFGKNYEEFHNANAIGTKNLLNAIEKNIPGLKRFVYLSTQTVGGPAPSLDNPITEQNNPNPITSYGKSKLAGEKEIHKYTGIIPYTILRAPAIYGPRDYAILPVFQSVKFGVGTLMGFDEKYISLLHVKDIVKALYDASISEKTINNSYYLSSDKYYTWKEIISIMKNQLNKKMILYIRIPHFLILALARMSEIAGNLRGKPPVFNYEKGIDFIQSYWICSAGNAKDDFGFEQNFSAEYGIKNTIEWYKTNNLL
jgi:dihydroflavonol-4-reductase